jgi:hypothetical protein
MAKRRTAKKQPPKAGKGGHKPFFFASPQVRTDFLTYLMIGCSRNDACKRIGCARKTLDNECDRNAEFKQKVEESELQAKTLAIGCVTKAAKTNPVIALQYLSRKWPNEWAYRKPDVITRAQFKAQIDQLIAMLLTRVPAEYHLSIAEGVNDLLLGVMSGEATAGAGDEVQS